MAEYIAAIDAGGTFTDCVLIDKDGEVTTEKTLTTHQAGLEKGVFESLNSAGKDFGLGEGEIFEHVVQLGHGTTIATNIIVENEGAKAGLLTSRGHEDTVRMMRGVGRTTGEPPENTFDMIGVSKPDPIVPASLIRGVPERVDSDGEVVSPLDESAARDAIRELVDEGIDSLSIVLLWAFKNPSHEKRLREIALEEAPDLYISCSHEVAPTVGEYERSVATCINSIVGPDTATYIEDLHSALRAERTYQDPFLLMQSNGGKAWSDEVVDRPITLIGSGPVGGLRGCEHLAREQGMENLIATDMGGTSFELGVIADGEPLLTDTTVVQKYTFNLPRLDIKSIGAGGGSIAHVAEDTESLRVGPQSAGADPGPACYGFGGTDPTVTDANLLLGYINPDTELGEQITPDLSPAREAIEPIGDQLGLSVAETVHGIFEVINQKMANLIENEIIGRGFDPRDFQIVSYGGAGPIHASAFASQLGVSKVVVPGAISPVWSAYGITQADIRYQFEREISAVQPVNPEQIERAFAALEDTAAESLDTPEQMGALSHNRVAKMRYKGQMHELEVSVPPGPLDEDDLRTVSDRFRRKYERRYSEAARLDSAVEEFVTLRLETSPGLERFQRRSEPLKPTEPPDPARQAPRDVIVDEAGTQIEYDVWDGTHIQRGNEFQGPAIVELPHTSIVVRREQAATVNEYGDFEIKLKQ